MHTNIFHFSLPFWVVIGGLLAACAVSFGSNIPANFQISNSITLTPDANGALQLTVPVFNASNQPTSGAILQIDIRYWTDANGASLTCSPLSSQQPCAQPTQCTRSQTFAVPPLQPKQPWQTPPLTVGDPSGACACLTGHCGGAAQIALMVQGRPPTPAETLPNTVLQYVWSVSEPGYVQGFTDIYHQR